MRQRCLKSTIGVRGSAVPGLKDNLSRIQIHRRERVGGLQRARAGYISAGPTVKSAAEKTV
jgi:hypothetical protein